MSLKGTPYYGMALDAGASKGDEAEQMAQMIQADHWESQFKEGDDMWLDTIEKRINQEDEGEPLFRLADVKRIARVLREVACYVVFLETYCSKRMSPEKARKRFVLSDDAKEICAIR